MVNRRLMTLLCVCVLGVGLVGCGKNPEGGTNNSPVIDDSNGSEGEQQEGYGDRNPEIPENPNNDTDGDEGEEDKEEKPETDPEEVDPGKENQDGSFEDQEPESDRDNLISCGTYVEFPDYVISGMAWMSDGYEMSEEFIESLVPGSVIEVSYTSEDGSIWLVFPWAEVGWMDVGQGEGRINSSQNIAQFTYEQIAEICGEDRDTWGVMLQCKSMTDWTVYSVKIGIPE